MAGFLSSVPSTPMVAASFLGASTVLSFIKGYTTTAAIGGADMRMCPFTEYIQMFLTGSFFSCRDYGIERLLVSTCLVLCCSSVLMVMSVGSPSWQKDSCWTTRFS
jgi:hypothetical protein